MMILHGGDHLKVTSVNGDRPETFADLVLKNRAAIYSLAKKRKKKRSANQIP